MIRQPRGSYIVHPLLSLEVATSANTSIHSKPSCICKKVRPPSGSFCGVQLALYAIRRTPHRAPCLVQAMPARPFRGKPNVFRPGTVGRGNYSTPSRKMAFPKRRVLRLPHHAVQGENDGYKNDSYSAGRKRENLPAQANFLRAPPIWTFSRPEHTHTPPTEKQRSSVTRVRRLRREVDGAVCGVGGDLWFFRSEMAGMLDLTIERADVPAQRPLRGSLAIRVIL